MEIKSRLYPYPVLAYFNDDYINSSFNVNVSAEIKGHDLVLVVTTALDNPTLEDLIKTGKASLLYHVECPETGLRMIKKSDQYTDKIILKEDKVNGLLHFCPFIIATAELNNYYNDRFNPEYTEPVSRIEMGSVLGIAQETDFPIEKNRTDLIASSSPFRIAINPDESQSNMIVEYQSGKFIKIMLCKDDYNNVFNMQSDPILKPILNQMIIVPALSYVLGKLGQESEPDSAYGDTNWYSALKKILKDSYKVEISELKDADTLELAQQIMKTPVNQGLSELVTLGNLDAEDEDGIEVAE